MNAAEGLAIAFPAVCEQPCRLGVRGCAQATEAGAEMLEVVFMIAIGVLLASVVMGFVANTLAPGLQLAQRSYYHTLYQGEAEGIDPLGGQER